MTTGERLIYLDHLASTPLDPGVRAAMLPWFEAEAIPALGLDPRVNLAVPGVDAADVDATAARIIAALRDRGRPA